MPDLEVAWELYGRGDKDKMLRDFFFVSGATGLSLHRYAYDFELLSCALAEAGSIDVQRQQHGEGTVPDLNIPDHCQEYTLFVEACKPALQEASAQ